MSTTAARLREVLSDGKWHRARDIATTDRQRRALRDVVRWPSGESRYVQSWTPVLTPDGRTTRLRIVRRLP